MSLWRPTQKRSTSRSARRRTKVVQAESLESRTLLTSVLVTVENLSPDGGLFETPFWIGFHDGNFDIGDSGEAATGGLEELAEDGDTSVLSERFAAESDGVDATITGPEGIAGVLDTGETVSFEIDVEDTSNQYFSFASMVIPSNDSFLANLNSEAYKVFRNNGRFRGEFSIDLLGSDVYDAGTEVNDPFGGAAFSTEGGTPVDENGVIRPELGLDSFIGTGTPAGDLQTAFDPNTPLARITVSLASDPSDPIDNSGPMTSLGETRDDGSGTFEVDVVFTDPSGVDLDTIDARDAIIRTQGTVGVRRLKPSGYEIASSDEDNRTVTVTYVFDAPGGEFDASDSGEYTLRIKRNRVRDAVGNRIRGTTVGSVVVDIPVQLSVTVENLAEDGGLYLTPFFVGVHDGGFDIGSRGGRASEGLEALAEEGDTSGLTEQFGEDAEGGASATIVAPDGFEGVPVFDPGESVTQILDVSNPGENQFFSFASMIIPSNDAFIGNLSQRAHRLFTARGQFRGPVTIMVYGNDVWDAGTEVNDPQGGAPFSTEGGESTDEGGRIRRSRGIDNFVGTGLVTGADLDVAFSRRTPIARITIDLADGGDE